MRRGASSAVGVRVLFPGGTSGGAGRSRRSGVDGVWRVADALYCRLETPAPGRVFVAADAGWYGGVRPF